MKRIRNEDTSRKIVWKPTQTKQTLEHTKNCPRIKRDIQRDIKRDWMSKRRKKKWLTVIQHLDTDSFFIRVSFSNALCVCVHDQLQNIVVSSLGLHYPNHFITCKFETISKNLLCTHFIHIYIHRNETRPIAMQQCAKWKYHLFHTKQISSTDIVI